MKITTKFAAWATPAADAHTAQSPGATSRPTGSVSHSTAIPTNVCRRLRRRAASGTARPPTIAKPWNSDAAPPDAERGMPARSSRTSGSHAVSA
ncbi:Uncharacterised protein [Mycobacteroides abscessus]|nr:Uncharacterised protein [Mycobacteroides abscessus]